MNTAVISLKVDSELKREATKVASDLGIPLATYLKLSLKKLTRERRVDISLGETLQPEVGKELLRRSKDKKNWVGPFKNADDLMKSLQG